MTIEELKAENARLKAEVERLRIAGGESEPRFVMLSDYRHLKAERDDLKAEVERLTAFTTRTIIPNEELQAQVERVGAENAHLHKGIYSMSLNVAQLKDEVERLTKAGDAMRESIICGTSSDDIQAVLEWDAAKEGEQP